MPDAGKSVMTRALMWYQNRARMCSFMWCQMREECDDTFSCDVCQMRVRMWWHSFMWCHIRTIMWWHILMWCQMREKCDDTFSCDARCGKNVITHSHVMPGADKNVTTHALMWCQCWQECDNTLLCDIR